MKGWGKMIQEKYLGKDFALLIAGQIVSLFGNAILRFSLPLYLLRLTGSSVLFGIVTACSFLPMIVLSILGGVMADRINKRNIMVGLDFITAIIVTACYLLLDKVPVIPLLMVVLMLLYGIAGMEQPTVQASVPALVKKEGVLKANAIVNQVGSLANFIGPILGGMLFGIGGILPILQISSICFFLASIMELFLVIPYEKTSKSQRIFHTFQSDLLESWQFIRLEKPVFLHVCVIITVLNMTLSAMLTIGIPVLLIDVLEVTDQMLGVTQGMLAAGGLMGGLLLVIFGKKMKVERAFILLFFCSGCTLIMGITMIICKSVMPAYLLLSSMSFLVTVFSTTFSIQMLALVQTETPKHLVGKVIASIIALIMCAQPIGQLLYGILFELFPKITWSILLGTTGISFFVSIYSIKTFMNLKGD